MKPEIKHRGFTGKRDKFGKPIYEGDVIEEHHNEFFGLVRALVHWSDRRAGFCTHGHFAGRNGGGWSSLSLEHSEGDMERLGSYYDSPTLLHTARKVMEPGPVELWEPDDGMLLGQESVTDVVGATPDAPPKGA